MTVSARRKFEADLTRLWLDPNRPQDWGINEIAEAMGCSRVQVVKAKARLGLIFTSAQRALQAATTNKARNGAVWPSGFEERALQLRNQGYGTSRAAKVLSEEFKEFLTEKENVLSKVTMLFKHTPPLTPIQISYAHRTISDESRAEIVSLMRQGLTNKQIEEKTGISQANFTYWGVVRGPELIAQRNAFKKEENYTRFLEWKEANPESPYQVAVRDLGLGINQIKDLVSTYGLYLTQDEKKRRCRGRSQAERDIEAFLIESLGPENVQHSHVLPSGKEVDIYVPSLKLGIEYCGLYWHSEVFRDRYYHINKLRECQAQGIRLLTVFSDEWISRQQAVKCFLSSFLKPERTYGARKLLLESVRVKNVEDFLDENHIQGGVSYGIAYTLSDDNGIVAAMTFFRGDLSVRGKSRDDDAWTLSRYCIKKGCLIQGGFARLFRAFVKDHVPETVITYADKRWSEGGVYKRNGFELVSETPPSYWYNRWGYDSQKHHHTRFSRKKIEKKLGPILDGESEAEAMTRFGFSRVWDCGLMKFVWRREPRK